MVLGTSTKPLIISDNSYVQLYFIIKYFYGIININSSIQIMLNGQYRGVQNWVRNNWMNLLGKKACNEYEDFSISKITKIIFIYVCNFFSKL